MSVFSGPEISTNGLVFAYDFNNDKSFKSPPLTNYQSNGGAEFDPWTVSGVNTNVTGTSDEGPIKTMKTWKFVKTGTTNQWNGWEAGYGGIWTGSAGDIWTTSYWYKTAAPAGLTGFGVGSFFVGDWSRAYNTTILSNRSTIIADDTWRWNYTITQFNESYSSAIIVDGPSWGYSTSAGTLYINGLQWNKNAYATPKSILGTITTANSIIDLTGGSTITANSLTYPYDGSSSSPFSFNGSSNWIELPTSSLFDSQSITMESWNNPTTTAQNGFLFEKGQVNTQYSNFYNSDGTFYFRTIGLSPQDLTFTSSSYITANKWNHVVCTVGNGTKVVYVNGNIVAQATGITGTMPTGQTNQYIGKYGSVSNQYPFNGSIAVSKVYNRALTASEVQQNFNALRGRFGI
jgi:hypothetical protein